MKEEPKTIAEVGYFVEPAKNGGFVLFSGGDSGPMRRDQYAFSNASDLITFLIALHGVTTPALAAHPMSFIGKRAGGSNSHGTIFDNERC